MINLSGPSDLGPLDAKAAVRRLVAPTLLVAGRDDPYAEDARVLFDASMAPQKRLELFDNGRHGTELLRGTAGASTRAVVMEFLRAATGAASRS